YVLRCTSLITTFLPFYHPLLPILPRNSGNQLGINIPAKTKPADFAEAADAKLFFSQSIIIPSLQLL
ncbi:MAG: hypothetical protein LBD23_13770, partial [Oscillospiraceae bacterium]|nr:hypothetical protein [Oscillospiraceae bacterium]